MAFEQYILDKKAFIFELDNVIYPEKDYLLQVYYLFAQFMEYGEQLNAEALLNCMKDNYLSAGDSNGFSIASKTFHIDEKYRVNYDLLMISARLPLKLFIFSDILRLLQELIAAGKQIFIFTNGIPAVQLNKIRQVEWHGIECHLEVHFAAETEPKPSDKGLNLILDKCLLDKADVLMIGNTTADKKCAENAGVDYLEVEKLLLS